MYLEMATEEDKKMVEDWKADADGILIFVRLSSNRVLYVDSLVIDWSILCCRRDFDISVHPGPSAEPTRHFQLLPSQYISSYD